MASSTSNGITSSAVTSSAERLRYFLGQLLTQRDLEAEQRYHVMLRRLLQRELLGTGTVAGLGVVRVPSETADNRSVVVQGGLAIDPDGRELLMERDVLVEVAALPETAGTGTFPPSTTPDSNTVLATDVRTRFALSGAAFAAANVDSLITRLTSAGLMTAGGTTQLATLRGLIVQVTETPPGTLPGTFEDWLFGQLVGTTHIGLQYREDGGDPSPAVVDASCCAGVSCFPSRTQQGVFIVASPTPYPELRNPYQDFLDCLGPPPINGDTLDCEELRRNVAECITAAWRRVPSVTDVCGDAMFPILPLAVVRWSRFARSGGRILSIDNTGERLLALGMPMLRAITESIMGCASGGV